MFSRPLFMRTVKSNYKVLLIITAVLSFYLIMICAVFTPKALGEMMNFMENMGEMSNMFGSMNSVIGFIGQGYYGMIAVMFPMIYCIVVGNKLIAAQVDKGSMAYLLSTPTKRNQITITNGIYFALSIAAMFAFITALGIGACSIFQPDELDIGKFLIFNLGAFLLMFAISGICYLSSCIFNQSRYSIAFGTGIPLAFFLFKMLAESSEELSFFKYLSLNTLFDPNGILMGESFALKFCILAAVGLVCYIIGIRVFREKDLPL